MIHVGRVPAGRLVFNLNFCKIFVFMGAKKTITCDYEGPVKAEG
jgi:hypothetical protein